MSESSLAGLLQRTIEKEMPLLREADRERVAVKPAPSVWSPQQELGHLIDSAANNHQRIVRAALEPEYTGPGYAQDAWVEIHGYQDLPWEKLVSFWFSYNSFLVTLIQNISAEKLETRCTIGSGAPVTLGFVIEDYVKHMQHHLDKILARELVTQYP